MSARSRPRTNHNQDTDEERRLWKEIKDKARDVDDMVNKSNTLGTQILEAESTQAALIEDNKPTDATLDDKLEKLYRENLKLCEEVQHILEGSSHDMPLLDSIKILAGLREASEESALAALAVSQSTHRSASSKNARPNKKSAGSLKASASTPAIDDDETPTTAAPSPRIHLSANSRHNKTSEQTQQQPASKPSRASSLIPTRETSVKLEEGAETPHSTTTSTTPTASTKNPAPADPPPTTAPQAATTTTATTTSTRPPRLSLKLNEIVFHRHKDPSAEGEGILCRVTSVIGEGKQRRYEIQDVDASSPNQPPPMRASVANLMQIPQTNRGLGDLAKGRQVLAQYPDTTTFYRAEVSVGWSSGVLEAAAGGEGEGEEGRKGLVRLRFEGETEDILSEVERRFVLTEK
ncbi:hypothetical protein MBLNU230_g8522t1 [Neophaeotheca triangularis]